MTKFLLFVLVVLGAEVAAGRYLQQTSTSPLLPSTPTTEADFPILVYAPLAESQKPARLPCPTIDNNMVDPATLMPTDGSFKPVFQLKISGFRNYSCGPDGINPDSLSTTPVITPVPGSSFPYGGLSFYNEGGLPQIDFFNPADNSSVGTMVADSRRTTFEGRGDTLKWRRWPVFILEGPLIPWVQYIVMNETSGGQMPAQEACLPGEQWVRSPYNATYTYWTC